MLYSDRHATNGTWVPAWLVAATKNGAGSGGRAVKSEARARVMSELLWWFELAFSDRVRADQRPKGGLLRRCRARVYDVDGLQWLAASTRMPDAPRSPQNRTTRCIALRTCGWHGSRSGWKR